MEVNKQSVIENKVSSVNKVMEMEQLAEEAAQLRSQGKKIVYCHGVFDLLHVGHIRHFRQAKKFGDVLVVTITPDHFVNKGPHRPTFPAHLRAEAVAALDCVDYVAINRWAMAVEAIRLLKPHYYVKGSDYRNSEKDYTGGIALEEEAVTEVGGQLVFTDDISYSSSSLINRHLPAFPREVSDYLSQFSRRYSMDQILGYLDQLRSLKVLVVGETIIDEYQYCEAIGKSSKEPMLAIKRLSTEQFLGGVLAVANTIANFCDQVAVITFLGDQSSHEDFIHAKLSSKVKPTFLYRRNSPTIVKRRFIESYFFTKLLEIYEINDELLSSEDNRSLCKAFDVQLNGYDAVIVTDFGHGMFSEEAIALLCSRARFLAVNAQSNAGNVGYQSIAKYPSANYICMAENEVRMEARDRRGDLKHMILNLVKKSKCEHITVTRGKNGCLCYDKKIGFLEIPAFAGQILDRMGAGDAFLSLTALCVAQGVPTEVVGFIGNVVGAQAVATVGHRKSIERAALYKHIESLLK